MLYQDFNSKGGDYFKLERGGNLSFPPHIHSSFEIITITQGCLDVIINNEVTCVKKGESALIFPNQIHEFRSTQESEHVICIFSPQLVRAYSKQIEGKAPKSNVFLLSSHLIEHLRSITYGTSIIELKGLLYSICSEFDKEAEYIDAKDDKRNLLLIIFKFIEQNFAKDCSLYELANATSYNYVYLSKLFNKYTNVSYTEYVNRRRINEACYLLLNSDKSIVDIGYECGFDCLRSFNRNFKKIMNQTPSEYISKARKNK